MLPSELLQSAMLPPPGLCYFRIIAISNAASTWLMLPSELLQSAMLPPPGLCYLQNCLLFSGVSYLQAVTIIGGAKHIHMWADTPYLTKSL